MEKFLKNIFLYFLTVGLLLLAYFWLGAYVAEIAYGLNTRKQILISFSNADSRQYNKMFLGNSRVYRGINPDKIDDHTYNFAHDNDTYNQCYYKLQHVLANGKKIDTLFLGADYFQFSIKSEIIFMITFLMLLIIWIILIPIGKSFYVTVSKYSSIIKLCC